MKVIHGKYTDAVIYTDVVEQEALDQIQLLCDQAFTEGARVRIMPDVHAGAGCTIGTTMTIKDKIVPNLVGVDIGCGMLTICLGRNDFPLDKLDDLIYKRVPSGQSVRTVPHAANREIDLTNLRCFKKIDHDYAQLSLGSLGGGNHFIEADIDDDGMKYIVIHTGSRHLGKEVASYYQKAGADRMAEIEKPDIRKIVEQLKAEGRSSEISAVLASLKKQKKSAVPASLAYVEAELFEDYIHDMKLVQQFARVNRKTIAEILLTGLGLSETECFETVHNYIDTESMILRKGAVSAEKGERLLIPINMRDGSLICTGKGNPEWNRSAPHGAGRLYSRKAAKRMFSVDEFAEKMKGIYTTSVNSETLDESPMCYKDMKDILINIGPTAAVEKVIRPIYNFKASS